MPQQWPLSEIRETARRISGLRSVSQVSDADVDKVINKVYRLILPLELPGNDLALFWSLSTAIGSGQYNIDLEVLELFGPVTLDDGDGDAVTPLNFYRDQKTFFELYPDDSSAANDQPQAVLLWGNENDAGTDKTMQLHVRPVPDAIYTIKFGAIIKPVALANETDETVFDHWGWSIAYATAIHLIQEYGGGDRERIAELNTFYNYHLTLAGRKALRQKSGLRSQPSF